MEDGDVDRKSTCFQDAQGTSLLDIKAAKYQEYSGLHIYITFPNHYYV